RYPGTLQHVAAELNADGTDYTVLSDGAHAAAQTDSLDILHAVLSQSAEPLTRQEILARWPATEAPPRAETLWRMLTKGYEVGMLMRMGAGNKGEAFRYGVALSQTAKNDNEDKN